MAEFLRAWGYTVPRELAKASSRTVLVVGSKEAAAHVSRALGDGLPVRQASHPYDALVFAGSDPADVYVVELREVGKDIDVDAMLEALHRASPQGSFVVLADEPAGVPAFATRVGRNDAAALRAVLLPGEPVAPAPPSAEEARVASGGSR